MKEKRAPPPNPRVTKSESTGVKMLAFEAAPEIKLLLVWTEGRRRKGWLFEIEKWFKKK